MRFSASALRRVEPVSRVGGQPDRGRLAIDDGRDISAESVRRHGRTGSAARAIAPALRLRAGRFGPIASAASERPTSTRSGIVSASRPQMRSHFRIASFSEPAVTARPRRSTNVRHVPASRSIAHSTEPSSRRRERDRKDRSETIVEVSCGRRLRGRRFVMRIRDLVRHEPGEIVPVEPDRK